MGDSYFLPQATFMFIIELIPEAHWVPKLSRSEKMAWKTPKIAEISVGMEINCYACAEL